MGRPRGVTRKGRKRRKKPTFRQDSRGSKKRGKPVRKMVTVGGALVPIMHPR